MIESNAEMIGEENNLIVDKHFELHLRKPYNVLINENMKSGNLSDKEQNLFFQFALMVS